MSQVARQPLRESPIHCGACFPDTAAATTTQHPRRSTPAVRPCRAIDQHGMRRWPRIGLWTSRVGANRAAAGAIDEHLKASELTGTPCTQR